LIPAKPLSTVVLIDQDGNGNVVGKELKSGQKGQCYLDSDGSVKDDVGNVVNFKK
jgi:hypothetical protein